MKSLVFLLLIGSLLGSCTDDCTITQTQRMVVPFQISQEQLRIGIVNQAPQKLENPGKIYYFNTVLIINEIKKGLHFIDNANPANPKHISFLKIPGVLDLAIKGNILYADSYTDLVAFDMNDIKNIKEVGRIKNMFSSGLVDGIYWYFDPFSKIITDSEYKNVTQIIKSNCGQPNTIWPLRGGGKEGDTAFQSGSSNTNATKGQSSSQSGTGGSMARFTIYDDYLYVATQSDLIVFNIKNGTKPDSVNKIKLGWGVETIFPYKDKLFIGSNTGMYIYDNKVPSKPVRLSIFQHVRACDPVVVENDKAYITLRSGWCGAAPNRLDVIDVKNLSIPFLIKSYTMESPHGLSILNNKLTICEGEFGLKSFDAKNSLDIKLEQHLKGLNAFDVIQLDEKLLLMIGKDGLHQYDNSDPKNMKLLSKMEVNR